MAPFHFLLRVDFRWNPEVELSWRGLEEQMLAGISVAHV